MQEFKLDRKHITLMKASFVMCLAFVVLGLVLLFNPGRNIESVIWTVIAPLAVILFFVFFSVMAWITLKTLPFVDVASDDDGIWYIHVGKDNGLIRWGQIYKVKERSLMQCLDLLDCRGKRLIKIEYQLHGFKDLRHILIEKTFESSADIKQSAFKKGLLYHSFYLSGVLGFSVLGFHVGSDGNPAIGYVAMGVVVAFITHEYLVTATGIYIDNTNLVITYPFIKIKIPFSNVKDILLTDKFHKGNRITEVWVISKNTNKPFKLKQIGADSNVIYKALRKAVHI